MTTPKEVLLWRYEIKYGPEGEANYAWVYDGDGEMICTVRTHHAKVIVSRMNSLASLEGDAVERVARIIDPDGFCSEPNPDESKLVRAARRHLAREKAGAILATGLVPDEAAKGRVDTIVSECGLEGAAAGWRPCSGCYETEDGRPVGKYPYSDLFKCDTGSGCHECGGLGVVWEYHSASDLAHLEQQLHEPDPLDEAAIRADEREKCAKVAKHVSDKWAEMGGSFSDITVEVIGDEIAGGE